MQVKKLMMLKDAGLVPEDEDEKEDKTAEAERECNRQLRKQRSMLSSAKQPEERACKATRGDGSSDDDSDIDSDDEQQRLNGSHHSLFGRTG